MDPVSGNDQELRGTLFVWERERERTPPRVLHRYENSPERATPLIPPLHPLSFSLCLQLHVILFQWCFLILICVLYVLCVGSRQPPEQKRALRQMMTMTMMMSPAYLFPVLFKLETILTHAHACTCHFINVYMFSMSILLFTGSARFERLPLRREHPDCGRVSRWRVPIRHHLTVWFRCISHSRMGSMGSWKKAHYVSLHKIQYRETAAGHHWQPHTLGSLQARARASH